MTILITICARGGSKGIPGKNIKLLNGIPLIAYTIKIAQDFAKEYDTVISISSDNLEILNIAETYGIKSDYKRPLVLASDNAGKIQTIEDLILFEESKFGSKFDYILDLDVTSPLRTINDLKDAFQLLLNNSEAKNLFSVSESARNPYFNMVEKMANGYYGLVKSKGDLLTRQTAPKVYDLNASFYFYRRIFFEEKNNTVFTMNTLVFLVPHLCFDLDHQIDFEFLEFLIQNNKLEFNIW